MQVISGKLQKAKKCCNYGPEGVGKSSFAAKYPRPVFIDTEGSTTELDVERLPKPSSWTMINQQVDWVKQQGNRFGTLVIDTIDWAEMLCVQQVCSTHGKGGIEGFGYGQGYIYVAEEMGKFLNKLSDLVDTGINVVLIAHSQIVKFEQPDEMGAYDRYQLKLGQKTGSRTSALVKEWADMVLFMNYKTFSVAVDKEGKKNKAQGGIRTIYANHHPAWDAKNRHGLPDEFPMEYAQIAHLFNAVPQTPTQQTQAVVQQPVEPMSKVEKTTQTFVNAYMDLSEQEVMSEGINPAIPQSLRDLMTEHQVTEEEIQFVVSQKGYRPMDMPITNYDPAFIDGVLVGAWPQMFEIIQEVRKKLPF